MGVGGCLEAGKTCSYCIQRIGKIGPGRLCTRSAVIDSAGRVPSSDGMLCVEYFFGIHAGEIIITLIKLPDMVETKPAIVTGAVIAVAGTIDGGGAKFTAFLAALYRAGPAVGFNATVKAVRFSFWRSFSQNPFEPGLLKPVCPLY